MLRGYSLNLVLIFSALLVVLCGTMFVVLESSGHTGGELLSRKQTFFATDGMMRATMRVADDFLAKNPDATGTDLKASFTTSILDAITPAGYSREAFDIDNSARKSGPVPNGAFEGMNADLHPVVASMKLRKVLSAAACKEEMSATLAQISMFQFMVFVDGYADWAPGPPQNADGRVHANGDICLASDSPFCLAKVTASGRIMEGDDGRCRYHPGAGDPLIAHDSTPDFTNCSSGNTAEWRRLHATDRDSGCTGCDGTGANWASWARTEFGNNALDKDMSTPQLKLPISGAPLVQAGTNANKGKVSNGDNSRFLVDPVRGADSADIVQQKFAGNADIRILDGVWYLPDPGAPGAWPGLPIWSDHPGHYTISATGADAEPDEASVAGTQAVGQDDIRATLAGRGILWGTTPPRLFSFYEVDDDGTGTSGTRSLALLDNDATATSPAPQGVISYGGITRISGPKWVPGHWPGQTGEDCPSASPLSASAPGFLSVFDTTTTPCTSAPYALDTALLNATRTGFRDGHIEQNADDYAAAVVSGSKNLHQKVLPVNFDVAAFHAAMASSSVGELGSYFCAPGGGCFMRRPFNGIVWIGVTWDGSLSGFAAGAAGANPGLWPAQGDRTNAVTQPLNRHDSSGVGDSAAAQRGLPYPLCSTSLAGTDATATGHSTTSFKYPACTDFGGGGGARPMAVRLINAKNVGFDRDFDGIDDGVTISSNLPVYVVGQWNTQTSSGATIDTSSGTASPWSPALVAADQIYLLSDDWNDKNEPWDHSVNANNADATNTTYNIEMLAGWSESSGGQYSGGIENFPRFIEDWSGARNVIRGSIVVGFNSPYYRWPRFCCGTKSYNPPTRDWAYDKHLDSLGNQPPGAPRYTVYATRAWRRQ